MGNESEENSNDSFPAKQNQSINGSDQQINQETEVEIEPKEFIDFPSLFTILSAHHVDEENKLRFGVQENKLSEILGIKKARLNHLLEQFNEEISKLGLEVVKYKDNSQNWITIRHKQFAPLNLSKQAEVLLGFSFGHFMELPKPEYKAEDFRLELTVRGFLTNAEYTNALDELVKKRYLKRSRGIIRLGIRSLLEFDEQSREKIGRQALELLRGKDYDETLLSRNPENQQNNKDEKSEDK